MVRRGMRYGEPAVYQELIAPRYAPIADALLRAAAPSADDDVLELGAGTGLVTRRAARLAGSLVATDRSAAMLDVARDAIASRPGLLFALVDYTAPLPFLDASFDLVLSGLTYAQDSASALAEIRRVLRPAGRLAVAMWGNGYHEYRLLSDALESVGRGRLPSPAPGRAVQRLRRARFGEPARVDIELKTRFPTVDEYIAYRRGFGVPLGWGRSSYEAFMQAVRREASRSVGADGTFVLGWTVTILTAHVKASDAKGSAIEA